MAMNAATRIANDDVFCEADAVMDRIKKELGVVLRYPTYRKGLRAIAAAA